MTWEFKFQAENGSRAMRQFDVVQIYYKPDQPGLWYYPSKKLWLAGCTDSCQNFDRQPKTFKAFKRYLNKHPELRGYEVVLVSKWAGYDITAEWKEKS